MADRAGFNLELVRGGQGWSTMEHPTPDRISLIKSGRYRYGQGWSTINAT